MRDLSPETIDRLLRTARGLMMRNLEGFPRVTRRGTGGPRQWVYGRSGQPCSACGTTIRMQRLGASGRSTYWCPACQPLLAASRAGPRPPRGRRTGPER